MGKPLSEVIQWMDYDESVYGCMVWNYHTRKGRIGAPVFCDNNRIPRFTYNGCNSTMTGKKIVWYYHHRELLTKWDSVEVKDGDEFNIKIDNLRLISYSDKIKNKQVMINAFRNSKWSDIFEYEDGKVYWKIDIYRGHNNKVRCCEKGKQLNYYIDKRGYVIVTSGISDGFNKRLHRIIYELCNDLVINENMEIDHIDGDKENNNINNLRMVKREVNVRNKKIYKNNNTGIGGVHLSSNSTRYSTFVMVDGKRKTKSYSINKYGKEKAFELVVSWREKEIQKLNEIFGEDGYTERHGKEEDNNE